MRILAIFLRPHYGKNEHYFVWARQHFSESGAITTELDFSDGLNGKGFYFNNPNASRSCGCGESFSV
jgi:hypothetical protein